MAQEEEANPHVGGTGGASSSPDSGDAGAAAENAPTGAGDIEIPIGLPVSHEEFRRLKEEARGPVRGREDAEDQAQEDPGTENSS